MWEFQTDLFTPIMTAPYVHTSKRQSNGHTNVLVRRRAVINTSEWLDSLEQSYGVCGPQFLKFSNHNFTLLYFSFHLLLHVQ